nr:MAG TPA: hypothetical protein [Bacteriophage sp.]
MRSLRALNRLSDSVMEQVECNVIMYHFFFFVVKMVHKTYH